MAYYSSGYAGAAAAAGVNSGDEVRRLQTQLNAGGAKIAVDGIYGPETDAAWRKYSSAASVPESGGSFISGVSAETAKNVQKYAGDFTPSQAVADAQKNYEAVLAEKPDEYVSPYDGALQALYDSIAGREDFTYDLNGDTLYRQYRDAYVRKGKAAMEDTMGQAAALTGGYGSTYAESAGMQAYDRYLGELGGIVPELYALALDRYEAEGDALRQRYDVLSGLRDADRQSYQDAYDAWQDAVGQSYTTWQDLLEQERETWADSLDYWTDRADAENKDYWTAYKAAGSGGGSGSAVKETEEEEPAERDTSDWGRYARAIDYEFSENAYNRFDLKSTRKQYLKYYRDEGLITVREYTELLNGDYGV